MPQSYAIKPDTDFLRRVLSAGGQDLKKCFQCATCSVACELFSGPKPFPRKEMIWAQWGLKGGFVAEPDIWRCHWYNNCSTQCLRGARPEDVLTAMGQGIIQHYCTSQILGKWANTFAWIPLMLVILVSLRALAILGSVVGGASTGGR